MAKPYPGAARKRRRRRPAKPVQITRESLEEAARQREQERLAGIEARRLHARRAVLGLEAARLAANGAPATAAWVLERWKQLEPLPQQPCWTILRPALGLEAAPLADLMKQWRKTREQTRSGALPVPDQRLAAQRKEWRKRRIRAWVRIGRLVLDNAAGGHDTAAKAISKRIDPRKPMP